MNDNDIIKALEHCRGGFCKECPYNEEVFECDSVLQGDALDLIKRQQAEIEKMNKRIEGQKHALFEQQSYTAELQNKIKTAKSEAIKEFADRLKGKAKPHYFDNCCYAIPFDDVDNLVKEMLGKEDEGK